MIESPIRTFSAVAINIVRELEVQDRSSLQWSTLLNELLGVVRYILNLMSFP